MAKATEIKAVKSLANKSTTAVLDKPKPARKKKAAASKAVATKKTKVAKSEATKEAPAAEKSWYDYPHYYDVGFREDTPREANFFEEAFEKYVPGKVKRVFEPGCGSGRLVVEMADRGYQVTGIDLNQSALDYCKERLKEFGLKGTVVKGDMTDFQFARPFDAAFNTINTFRHLLTEEDAVKHLKCVAANLRSGGIYILGLHLLPTGGEYYGTERWKAQDGKTIINYALTVQNSMPRQRLEDLKITMTIRKGKSKVKVSDNFTLRLYNARQMKSLLAQVPELVLKDVFDFWYEIEEPLKLDNEIADTVLILQKP